MDEQRGRALLARHAMVVVGYWLLWFVGWRLAIPFEVAPRISVWWPPSSVSLALLIVFGLRYLPAVAIPQLALMSLVVPGEPPIWVAITVLVCACYGAAAALVRRYAQPEPFASVGAACIFFLAAIAAAAAVAVPGSTIFVSYAGDRWNDVAGSSLAWWIGDLAAMSIITPFLVLTLDPLRHWVKGRAQPPSDRPEPGRVPTVVAALTLTVIALAIVVAGARATGYTWYFVLFLPTLYAGYALGPRGGAATALVVALCSLGLLHAGLVATRPLDLQFFMIGTAVASLLFAIVAENWRRAHRTLLAGQTELEQRVQARTAELAEANALLEVEVRVRREAERELIEAKEAAEASYRELETIYRNAPVGLALFDRELRYLRINETLAAFNGVSVHEHLGRALQDVVPALAPEVVPQMRRVIETGEPVSLEVRGRTAGRPGPDNVWIADFYPLMRPGREHRGGLLGGSRGHRGATGGGGASPLHGGGGAGERAEVALPRRRQPRSAPAAADAVAAAERARRAQQGRRRGAADRADGGGDRRDGRHPERAPGRRRPGEGPHRAADQRLPGAGAVRPGGERLLLAGLLQGRGVQAGRLPGDDSQRPAPARTAGRELRRQRREIHRAAARSCSAAAGWGRSCASRSGTPGPASRRASGS